MRVISSNSYYDLFSALQLGEIPQLQTISNIINEHGKGAMIFINNVSDSELMMSKMKQFQRFSEGKAKTGIIPNDQREYGIGAQIIQDLGITKVNLITRNPENHQQKISGFDIEIVEYTPL